MTSTVRVNLPDLVGVVPSCVVSLSSLWCVPPAVVVSPWGSVCLLFDVLFPLLSLRLTQIPYSLPGSVNSKNKMISVPLEAVCTNVRPIKLSALSGLLLASVAVIALATHMHLNEGSSPTTANLRGADIGLLLFSMWCKGKTKKFVFIPSNGESLIFKHKNSNRIPAVCLLGSLNPRVHQLNSIYTYNH